MEGGVIVCVGTLSSSWRKQRKKKRKRTKSIYGRTSAPIPSISDQQSWNTRNFLRPPEFRERLLSKTYSGTARDQTRDDIKTRHASLLEYLGVVPERKLFPKQKLNGKCHQCRAQKQSDLSQLQRQSYYCLRQLNNTVNCPKRSFATCGKLNFVR